MYSTDRLAGYERVKPSKLFPIQKQVGTVCRVRKVSRGSGMTPQLARPQHRYRLPFVGHPLEPVGARRDIEIALAGEMEGVVALQGHLFEQVDRSVHEP